MECRGCGNSEAWRTRTRGDGFEVCDACGGLGAMSLPDVYFRGPYIDPNLAHPDRPGEKDGVLVTSREHKLALMKEQNLYERGDRIHGCSGTDKALVRRAKEQGHGPVPK